MSKPLSFIAKLRAKPGREAEAEALLRGLLAPTREEPGSKSYILHRSRTEPGVFLFYEVWESREALDAHLAMPYIQAAFAKIPELFAGEPDFSEWEAVE
ncbi:MAG: antibiotic biosynthesis monooxygenase [Myxococcales bacterium]|nr:antibiotic biosynthesis monooxygenase [Myxococcales bacterium]